MTTRLAFSLSMLMPISVFALSGTDIYGQRATERPASRFAAQRASRSAATRPSQPQADVNVAERRTTTKKGTSIVSKRAVDIEIVFVEFEIPDVAKDAVGSFNGKSAAIETRLRDLKAKRQLKTLQRIQLSALDGQAATSQLGDRIAQVTGSNRFGNGRTSRSYQYQSFGTLATATPHVSEDGSVALDLTMEKSWPKGGEKASEPGEAVEPGGSATITVKNSIRLQPGTYAQVASIADESAGTVRQSVVLVSVQVGKQPVERGKAQAFRIVPLKYAQAESTSAMLGRLFTGRDVTFAAAVQKNAIVIATTDESVIQSVETVLKAIDVPGKSNEP